MTGHQIMMQIRQHDDYLIAHGVKRIGLFGSYARGEQSIDSDIDLIVEFDADKKTYDNFIELCYFLEDLFGRKVDLLTPESLSPFIRPHVEKDVRYETIH